MLLLLFKEIRHRWVIHLLTVLLIAFIISILVVQSSVNSSAEEKIGDLSHKLGRGMIVLPEGTDLERFYMQDYGDEVMPAGYPDMIRSSPLGKHVSLLEPRLYGNITVNGHEMVLLGRNMEFPVVQGMSEEMASVGPGVAKVMGVGPGGVLEVSGNKLRIYSVIEPPPKGFDMGVFVSLETARKLLGKEGINALHMGGCWCELDVAAFSAKVEGALPGTMAITVDGMAKAQIEIGSVMERYSLLFRVLGAVLAAGSIIFLIFYTLHKGGREVGLLLSIGLSPSRIVIRNLIIAVLISMLGALAGFVLSVPLMKYLGVVVMRISLSPAWGSLPWFAVAAFALSFVSAIVPSIYVSRLDPTKLLREE
ncbi:MAG: hypothetical protein JSV21_03370 [Nitrospirota bacterium]|nr:MAG: hypothetical protein JSV21_03370 [Nitrospirota bacterium]